MTDFSNDELDAAREALGKLREKLEEVKQSHMPFEIKEIKNSAPILTSKSDGELKKLLETLKDSGYPIKQAAAGGGMWKFIL